MSGEEYGLLISFPDQSHSFVHGYEAGILDQRMQKELGPISQPIHTANKDLYTRMCAVYGWTVTFKGTEYGEWTDAEFVRGKKPALTVVGA